MKICRESLLYKSFWRTLDQNDSTALYTADKVKNLFRKIENKFSNNDLKGVFGDGNLDSEAWTFVVKSHLLEYYYSDYNTVSELLSFLDNLKRAYEMTKPLTITNRYI